MAVEIGHARIDERGKATGGAAGDQNGQEVMITPWYNKPWDVVIRPKNSSDAERIAHAMEQACRNDHIGYNQLKRTTLFDEAEKVGFDISKVTKDVNTDCSALVAVCVNAAGIAVPKTMYTGNEHALLKATGKFDILTDPKYVSSSDNLKRGDILLKKKAHTAIVLTNGVNEQPKPVTVKKSYKATGKVKNGPDKALKGTYEATGNVNMRHDAGTTNGVLTVVPKGKTVKCYGYYNLDPKNNRKWLYVLYSKSKTESYEGFVSTAYLKKH